MAEIQRKTPPAMYSIKHVAHVGHFRCVEVFHASKFDVISTQAFKPMRRVGGTVVGKAAVENNIC